MVQGIGKLKESLDTLINLREGLYEERRQVIHIVREAAAKLEMVETQLNAIAFKKSRMQAAEYRNKKHKESGERRASTTRSNPRARKARQGVPGAP